MNMRLLCAHPVWVKKVGFYASCGTCPVCRMKRRREWMIRMSHHAITAKTALFVTLTYDEKHVPDNHTLVVRDVQLFYKRLRKQLKGLKIKYFTCGEYGPKTHRPHYHAIIFNLNLSHRELVYNAWGKCVRHCFKCKLITSADTKAFGYVAGYCTKKLGKRYNDRFRFKNPGKIPEFQTCSNGIGKEFCETILKLNDRACMYYNGREMIPLRYYRKVLGLTADLYQEILEKCELELKESIYKAYPETINSKDRYYERLFALRAYHQELVLSQLADWRQKV